MAKKPPTKSPKYDTVEVPGGRLAFQAAGRGDPVLLIHSVIADSRLWDREFPWLSKKHQTIRYDLRGFRASTPASAPYPLIGDVERLLDHVGVDRVFLVGSSMGGAIAVDYALAHPDSVAGLFLSAPGLTGGVLEPYTPEELASFQRDDKLSREIFAAWQAKKTDLAIDLLRQLWCSALEGEALERWRTMVAENAIEVFTDRSLARAEPRPPSEKRLSEIRVPTTVAMGDRDNPAQVFFARRIVRAIPGARLISIPGADHLVNLSTPDVFAAALNEALGDAPRRLS